MVSVKMCRFCSFMVCGDANWCDALCEEFGNDEISEPNDCGSFEFNPVDAVTLKRNYPSVVSRYRRHKREKALYARRMAGDWS